MKTIVLLGCIGFLLFSCASKPQQTEYSDDDIISKNQVDKNEDFIKKVSEDSKRQVESPFNYWNSYGNPNAKTSFNNR